MRQVLPILVALLLFLAAAGVAQQPGRHGSAPNHETASAPPAEDSDTATFTRTIAGQATEEQIARFLAMTKSRRPRDSKPKALRGRARMARRS
jgi:hypothetical protein